MGTVHRFLAHSSSHRRRLVAAWVWLLLVRASLALLRLDRTRRWLRRARGSPGMDLDLAEAQRVERAVESAARRVPGARCLAQALTAQLMLGRRGMASALRIGVRHPEDGPFGAHAWLEQGERVVFGHARGEEFTPLSEFEGGAG